MSPLLLSYPMKFVLISFFVFASVAGSEALEQLKAVTEHTLQLWQVAAWSITPGLVGGLAAQLIPDKMKKRRQFAGELLTSMIAGFIVGPLYLKHFVDPEDPMKLLYVGGACALAGFFGSVTLLFLAHLLRHHVSKKAPTLFNEQDDSDVKG